MRIGVDLVDMDRIDRLGSDSFLKKAFTPGELEIAGNLCDVRRSEFLAGRFAVKEAVMKALGSGMAGVKFLHIECLRMDDGSPKLTLLGSALQKANELQLTEWQVTISHEKRIAAAFVVMT